MLSYRLGTVNDFHWEFKPVLSYSKPHTFSTFLEKKKKEKMYLIKPQNILRQLRMFEGYYRCFTLLISLMMLKHIYR